MSQLRTISDEKRVIYASRLRHALPLLQKEEISLNGHAHLISISLPFGNIWTSCIVGLRIAFVAITG